MSSTSFPSVSTNGLSFTNIAATETDIGAVVPFASNSGTFQGAATPTGAELSWSRAAAAVYYAGSSQVVNFSYSVSSTSSTSLIDSVGQFYVNDTLNGPGVSLVAVENVYDTAGNLLGTDTFTAGTNNVPSITLSQAEQTVNVKVTLTMAVSSAGDSSSVVGISAIDQSFDTIAAPPATASIGDIVFNDINGSGLETGFDSGPGVAGITVDLLNGTGTTVLATTVTNSSGGYNFTGLAAGVYEVKFVAPTGFGFTTRGVGTNPGINSSANATTGITAPITLTAGQADHNVEAGLVLGGSSAGSSGEIGNTVWMDTNRDGLLSAGETGVAGVTVDLLDSSGSVLATTTTNATGGYQFTGLNAGVYEVQFVAPTGDQFTTQGATQTATDSSANISTGISAPITLAAGQTDNNVNAGLVTPPASLGSTVWMDTNRDGLLSAGETGVADVTVNLLNGTGTTVLATTVTNSSGTYAFTGLNAGVYEVQFVAPTGDQFTRQGGTQTATDSSAIVSTGISAPVTLAAGQTDNNVNAGLVTPPASISSYVFIDVNGNGIMDNTDYFVAGVTVDLWNAAGTSLIATTTTNSGGLYTFSNLNAGSYEISVAPPSGEIFDPQRVSIPAANLNNTSSVNQTTGFAPSVALTAGESYYNLLNVGLQTPALIEGTAFQDSNRNGIGDSGEADIGGLTVDLLNANGTSVIATTTTNSNGTYMFTGLAAGTYEVSITPPAGEQFTTPGVGGNPYTDSAFNQATGQTAPITLAPGQTSVDNAGFVTPPASLGSTVWMDTNRDGQITTGETGVAGVTVDLLNGTGTTVLATTVTNSSGTYAFTGLNAGVYEVQFVAPTGDQFTTQGATQTATDSSANISTGISAPVTLAAGQTDTNVNAGLVTPPTGSIGDYVWLDLNKNGLVNTGEPGVAGVTVDLLNAAGTAVLATTTTNSTGGYNFTGLNAGVYEVKFVAPTGDTFTTQGATQTATDSSPNVSTGITAPITLGAGQVDNNVNAGLQNSSSISVLKLPCSAVVNQCGQVTYTFDVTNTGSTALTNVKITDNIGSATNPDNITPTLVTTGTNGILNAGQTWVYSETVSQINCTTGNSGSVCHTTSGSHLSSGCTAWLHSSFNPTSCADGATYKFQGVSCSISGDGVGSNPIKVDCPDSEVTFSKDCSQAKTVYDSSNNCWVTTLPANCNPGSVFLTGVPLTIPSGCDLTNASVTWNVGDSSNNCGASSVQWDGGCTGYQTFAANGLNGCTDYNQIGVKSCDNLGSYGNGGDCNTGYGYNGSSYCDLGFNANGGGCGGNGWGYSWDSHGWQGSASDNCGTPENQYINSNCGDTTTCNSYSQGSGSSNSYGGWGGASNYSSNSYGGWGGGSNYSSNSYGGWGGGSNYSSNSYGGWGGGSNYSSNSYGGWGGGSSYSSNSYGGWGGGSNSGDNSNSGWGSWGGGNNSGDNSNSGWGSWGSGSNSGDNSYGGWSGGSQSYCGSSPTYNDNGCGDASTGSCGQGGSATSNATNIAGAADTVTVTAQAVTGTSCVTKTVSGSDLGSGCTAWLHSTFKPTSCEDGATYNFHNVTCTIEGSGKPVIVKCPDAEVKFSSACKTATTIFDASTKRWVTTLPANSTPGNVFLTGCPTRIPSGTDLTNGHVTWSIGDSTNNCGASTLKWDGTCTGFKNFDNHKANGNTNYNAIGVKSCDNLPTDGNHTESAGAPVKQYTQSNCGNSASITRTQDDTNTCGTTCTVTSTGATVTATDTKEVQVLGCNSNVSVGGTAPTGSLSATYGTAQTLEFTYNPGNTVSLKQVQAGLASVTGTNGASMAFMEISNNANPYASGAAIYFQGEVTSGEKIFADATTNVLTNTAIAGGHFSSIAGADIYAAVFSSQQAFLQGAAPVQTMAYNTSGSQAMQIGDTIGSLSVLGYVGAKGGHLSA